MEQTQKLGFVGGRGKREQQFVGVRFRVANQRQHSSIGHLGKGEHMTDSLCSTRTVLLVVTAQELDQHKPVVLVAPEGRNWWCAAWRGCWRVAHPLGRSSTIHSEGSSQPARRLWFQHNRVWFWIIASDGIMRRKR